MKTLHVIKVEHRTSKKVADKMGNEGRYNVLTVETSGQFRGKDELGREHIMQVPKKQTGFTAWVDSPIEGRTTSDFGASLKVGDIVPGDIVTREVEPYFIASPNGIQMYEGKLGRWVTTASVAVLGNTDEHEDFRLEILKAFRNRQFVVKGEGDTGAPGGNLEAAQLRERTRMEGHSLEAGLPDEIVAGGPEAIEAYSQASSVRQQDQGSTSR